MTNMTKVTFDIEELGEKIINSIDISKIEDNIISSDVIWDSILEELYDFEYIVYDEIRDQLEKKDIEIMHW